MHSGPSSTNLLGELLFRAGRTADARAAFETGLSRTPERKQAIAGLRATEETLTRQE